jgi:hypothetical protein
MRESYTCPDGREALIEFNEDVLCATVKSRDGLPVGRFQFELVNEDGDTINLLEDEGLPAALKLTDAMLLGEWHGQGITERVGWIVADQTSLSVAN